MGQIKIERVREKVKYECARIIQTKLNDPRASFITVQDVDLSQDFRHAKISVSVLGSEADKRKVMRMLDGARGYIQREVAGMLRTRVTPVLAFTLDTSVDKSFRVAEILAQIKKEKGPEELERSEDLEDSGASPSSAAGEDSDDEEDDEGEADDEDEESGEAAKAPPRARKKPAGRALEGKAKSKAKVEDEDDAGDDTADLDDADDVDGDDGDDDDV